MPAAAAVPAAVPKMKTVMVRWFYFSLQVDVYILNHKNSVPMNFLPTVPPPVANVAPVVNAKAAAATVPNAMPSFVTNAANSSL